MKCVRTISNATEKTDSNGGGKQRDWVSVVHSRLQTALMLHGFINFVLQTHLWPPSMLLIMRWEVGMGGQECRNCFCSLKSSLSSTGHRGAGHYPEHDREVCRRHRLWPHLLVHLWALPNNHPVRTNTIKTHRMQNFRCQYLHLFFKKMDFLSSCCNSTYPRPKQRAFHVVFSCFPQQFKGPPDRRIWKVTEQKSGNTKLEQRAQLQIWYISGSWSNAGFCFFLRIDSWL